MEGKGSSIQITSSAPTLPTSAAATPLQNLECGRQLRTGTDTKTLPKAPYLLPPAALDLSSKALSASNSGKSKTHAEGEELGSRFERCVRVTWGASCIFKVQMVWNTMVRRNAENYRLPSVYTQRNYFNLCRFLTMTL